MHKEGNRHVSLFLASTLNPVAFKLGPLSVHWYGIILGSATLIGLWVAIREGRRLGVHSDVFLDMLLWVLPAAIVGARLYFVAFQWEYYSQHPGEIIAIWNGGIAIYGALIGAVLAGYFYTRKIDMPFLKLADIVAPSILLGQAIGRWGNFVNQEAHGGEVTRAFLEGLHLPDWIIRQMYIEGAYYHPTFLYESVWNFAGVLLLLVLRRLNLRRGGMFFSYIAWYALGRFFIEGLRTDSLAFDGPGWLEAFVDAIWSPMSLFFEPGAMAYGNIRTSQLLSLLLFIAAAAVIVFWQVTGKEKQRYTD